MAEIPSLPAAEIDKRTAQATRAIAANLSELPEKQRAEALQKLISVLARSDLGFAGKTLSEAGPQGETAGAELAAVIKPGDGKDKKPGKYMGVKAGDDTTELNLTPFGRNSESASGAVFHRDATSGDVMILLEVPKRNMQGRGKRDDAWELIAGYHNVARETELPMPEGDNRKPPTFKNLDSMREKELAAMKAQGLTASEIAERFTNPDTMHEMLERNGINWQAANDPNPRDATITGTFQREVAEETGIALHGYQIKAIPGAALTGATALDSGRKNHTDHQFIADLGILDAAPDIKKQESEISEAKWIRVKDIKIDAKGDYRLTSEPEANNTLRHSMGVQLDRSLEAYANQQVELASRVEIEGQPANSAYDSVRDVVAELQIKSARQRPVRSDDLDKALQASTNKGHFKSFIGQEGQNRMDVLIKAAQGLANDLKVEEIFPPPPNAEKAAVDQFPLDNRFQQ